MNRFFRTNRILRLGKSIRDSIMNWELTPIGVLVDYMNALSIHNVLDIGANVGQFGIDIRRYGFSGRIYSYEPVKSSFKSLLRTTCKDENWSAFPLALGIESGWSKVNVSGNDGLSSSILSMGKLHKEAFPNSDYIYSEDIELSTLDAEVLKLDINPKETLIKIDVQGFEKNVLLGGQRFFPQFPASYLEASISPLYDGEATFIELINLLDSSGHDIKEIFRASKDRNGRLLQVDLITQSQLT